MATTNPYAANDSAAEIPAESKAVGGTNKQAIAAMVLWGIGAFLVPLLIGFGFLTGNRFPGGVLYVSFVGGPVLAIVGALATPYGHTMKAVLIFAVFCLLPVQLIVIGAALIAASGFEGIH